MIIIKTRHKPELNDLIRMGEKKLTNALWWVENK